MMDEFPRQLPRGEWWAGRSSVARGHGVEVSGRHEHHRHAVSPPRVLAAEIATVDHLSNGRVDVGVGEGWMPEEFAAASAAHIFPKRHKHVRETIEIMQGIWTNDLFEHHGEFADFDRYGFGAKPLQDPHPPIFFSGLKDPKRWATASPSTACRVGSASTTRPRRSPNGEVRSSASSTNSAALNRSIRWNSAACTGS
jgi:dimethylsulfone monooxygenase